MNEAGETMSFSPQKKGGLDKGVIVNIVFISIAILVIGIASSIFYGAFAEGRFKDTTPKGDTYSNFKGEEQYYEGEEGWYLDIEDDNNGQGSEEIQQIEEASYEDLKKGIRIRISEGGVLLFDIGGDAHEMSIDSVNGNSVELTIQSNQIIFSSINVGDYGMFDLDGDFVYDLKVSLLEIASHDGIFDISSVSEEYQPEVEGTSLGNVSEFTVFDVSYSPYSCTEKDGYVEYSFLQVSTADGNVYDEKKVDVVREDVCVGTAGYYRKYYCEGKEFKSTYVYCDLRFESCSEAECVKSKYERLLSDSENAEEDYTNSSECVVRLGSNTFWFSSDLEDCESIYVASKIFERDVFFDYMDYVGLYYPVFRAYFTNPGELSFYYIDDSGNNIDLSYMSDIVESDECEDIRFLEKDTYCFNSIPGEKDNNLEYFFYMIDFLNGSSFDYGSSFVTGETFEFLDNRVTTYVDSSATGVIQDSKCQENDYAAYGNNKLYVCMKGISGEGSDGNRANVTIDVFSDLLGSLSGYNQGECYNLVINTSYVESGYGDNLEQHRPSGCCCDISCFILYHCPDDECEYHNDLIIQYEDYDFLDMNSLLGEKVNFLYRIYKNYEIPYSERMFFYAKAEELVDSMTCIDGIFSQYIDLGGKDIVSPTPAPDRYIIP